MFGNQCSVSSDGKIKTSGRQKKPAIETSLQWQILDCECNASPGFTFAQWLAKVKHHECALEANPDPVIFTSMMSVYVICNHPTTDCARCAVYECGMHTQRLSFLSTTRKSETQRQSQSDRMSLRHKHKAKTCTSVS